MADNPNANWKLKLRYGRLTTPYKHFTALAEGEVTEVKEGFDCRVGNAIFAMKMWASSAEESMDMVRIIGEHVGFRVTGRIYLYDNTEPTSPPESKPFGYDLKFTPYGES